MKPLSLLVIFILAIHLIISEKTSVAVSNTFYCHRYSYPFDYKNFEKVKCNPLNRLEQSELFDILAPLSPADAFSIDFHCGISNSSQCQKAQLAFNSVGNKIASTLQINTPIRVNATFTDLCNDYGQCSNEHGMVLGAARAAQTIPIKDPDGAIRYYPQALVKQLGNPTHATFNDYDILAYFNSRADMYFKNDGSINSSQFDFEYIVTHEFIHGLGFFSYWANYNYGTDLLTPYPVFLDATNSRHITFTGFIESAFDRYILLTEPGKPSQQMTQFVGEFNNFLPIGTSLTREEFFEVFQRSPAYSLGQQLAVDAVTPQTMNFTRDNTKVLLETKINPYSQGSSISHVDTSYKNGPDFLMAYTMTPGITLDDLISQNDYASAIGPNLTNILVTLGYSAYEKSRYNLVKENSGHGIKYSFFYNSIGVFITIILLKIL